MVSGLWVIIKIVVVFFLFNCCNKFIIFLDDFVFKFFVGLLVNNNCGWWIIVCVMVICCVCLLEIFVICFFNRWLIFKCLFNFVNCCFIIEIFFLLSVNGKIIFFLIVNVGIKLKFWKINFNFVWWNLVICFWFKLFGFFLFKSILLFVGLLIVVNKFKSVFFLFLEGFIILINLLFWIVKLIFFKVLYLILFL